ncbi:hypothetical protein TraAM80_00628 [Trypanosoma rangeli]|uniref:Transmembrane protein n=1 Tax=Trypanosoma rangeli TaxID=5698 RepID=A0A422P2I5_TRYRA|nr:uncharacterized protein TraAM80_00628 [Trypanosoma rangeli]RNF11933.1 hypothetical protein TraAM80_00628 [Trypanosoma rangeli]|eukprot:RNF11933.1 hypothetical protein TraAM80_00628 [Trypanosoma rangeli]
MRPLLMGDGFVNKMSPPGNCSVLPYSSATRLNCIMCMAAAVLATFAGIFLFVQYFGFFYSSALRSVFNDVFVVVVVVQVVQAMQLFIFSFMTVLRGERILDAGSCSPSGMTYAMCNINASLHQYLDAVLQVLQTIFFLVLANSRRLFSLEQLDNSDDGRIFRTGEGETHGTALFLWEHGYASSGVSNTSSLMQSSPDHSDARSKRRCLCFRQSEATGPGFSSLFPSCCRCFFSCCRDGSLATNRAVGNNHGSNSSNNGAANNTIFAATSGTSASLSVLQSPLVSHDDDGDVTAAAHPKHYTLLRLTWKFYVVAFVYAFVLLFLCWILLLYVLDIVVVSHNNGIPLEASRTVENTLFFSQKLAWCWIPTAADLSPPVALWQKSVLVLLQLAAAYAWPMVFFLVRCMRTLRCDVLPLPCCAIIRLYCGVS